MFLRLLFYMFEMSTPLLFVIMGGIFVQRAGVFNFALESAINTGAFCCIAITLSTRSLILGIIGAIVACVLVNMFFGLMTIKLKGHTTIVGMAINLLTAAIIPYLMSALYNTNAFISITDILDPGNVPVDVPILRDIPILGDILNKQTPLTYLGFLAVIVLTIVYYKTKFGTYVRVVGDSNEAAEAIGIKVNNIKFWSLVISGVCCALAGMNISMESVGMYTLGMSASRGYICLSAINCGKKEPLRSVAFGLLFGLAKGMQVLFSNYVGSTVASLLEAVPYVAIILVLVCTEVPAVRRNPMRIFTK